MPANRERLRASAREILKFVGLGDPDIDDGYLDSLERLNDACVQWFRDRAPAFGFLHMQLPPFERDAPIVTGPLSAAAEAWCCNAAAKDFFQYIDRETGHVCSLLQFQILRLMQEINAEAEVNAPHGGSA